MKRIMCWISLLAVLVCAAPTSALNVEFQPWLGGFALPVNITNAGDGSGRLFVCEQRGRLRIIKNGAILENDFINLSSTGLNRVSLDGPERGLLAIAFHPDYESNGAVYISYTARTDGRSVLARYQVDPKNPDSLLPDETVILTQAQPQPAHNGGHIAFGPDGYLYMSFGDGGGIGDDDPGHNVEIGNGQDRSNIMGDMIRIDVDHPQDPLAYGIPADNPYVASEGNERKEIWAYGLRNPWRYSFDRFDGRIFLGDVGDFAREEVDLIVKGGNYGWRRMEGTACYNPTTNCQTGDLITPIFEYNHIAGCCIIGGHVYRGEAYPAMDGLYIATDYCSLSGHVLKEEPKGTWTKIASPDAPDSGCAFGEDEQGELYLCVNMEGDIYKVVDTDPQPTRRDLGDFNGDYCTSLSDFLFMLDNWSLEIEGTVVGLDDFLAILDNWQSGSRCP